ncbi:MAG: hypothetical protein RR350_08130, partial [Oscillibacter sp.]
MKKRILAMLCVLTLLLGTLPAAGALVGEEARAADTLSALGLLAGDETGYALSEPATRAQAVAMTVRLAGAQKAAQADRWISGFLDVPAWIETDLNYAS